MPLNGKRFFTALVLGSLCVSLSGADTWGTDIRKARKEGRERKLPVMMVFTGSDWCQPAIALERNVLNQRRFLAEASKKYILFRADFPRNTRLGERLESQNRSLASRYGVYSYPTVIVVHADGGHILAKETGFAPGITPEQFLETFDSKLKQKKAR